MSSSGQNDVVHKFSCRCFNIIINASSLNTEPASETEPEYIRAFVGEHGIRITHHYLTLRTRFRAQKSSKSPNRLTQPLALSCLACNTLAYRVDQEIYPEAEVREGPLVPSEDWVEQETLRSKSGWVEVFVGRGGCLVGESSIGQHSRSLYFSRTFSIAVLTRPPTPTSKPSSPQSLFPSTDTPIKPSISSELLPPLPPLFPPPPFTPSHPVFVSLSTRAVRYSAELRARAEDDCQRYVQSQLDLLEKEEAQLRTDVEGIWKGYREGWKEMLGKLKEERRLSATVKSGRSMPSASAKSGVPLSIRDFSPVLRSHPQLPQLSQVSSQVLSPSLLSASLAQGGAHFQVAAPESSKPNTATLERVVHSSESRGRSAPVPYLQQVNGARSRNSSSLSNNSTNDAKMLDGFKRNMDVDVDIASSLAWVKGEEQMRRRLGGAEKEPAQRARNRTSKDLGIGAVEKNADPRQASFVESKLARPAAGTDVTADRSNSPADAKAPQKAAGSVVDSSMRSLHAGSSNTGSSDASGESKKAKRRVTFDVLPDAAKIVHGTPEATKQAPEVELFDLDDLASTEPPPDTVAATQTRPRPVTRTSPYKLHINDSASNSRAFRPTSMPAPRAIQPLSPVNGTSRWANGSLRRSSGLADTLPLLGSSVPASDRLLGNQQALFQDNDVQPLREPSQPLVRISAQLQARAPSPLPPNLPESALEPAELTLKHLLAASAPSHRHAWREGGKAWEMFHRRSLARKARGAIVEEPSDQSTISEDNESLGDDTHETGGPWHNPSQFASSLPIQIHPLAEYKSSLEPKTSLAEKQGVLVPPLKAARSHSNSAAAFRKAVYAERDLLRSIDPGPTLGFDEHDETDGDEYLPEDIGEGERGRRHALSILQARSVVPEAGMWRSMAS